MTAAMTTTPPQPPWRLAAAPNETPPPQESNQSANRAKPEGPPTIIETIWYDMIQPASIFLLFIHYCVLAYLGPASGNLCVSGNVTRCNIRWRSIYSVDRFQKSFLTLGLWTTRQPLEKERVTTKWSRWFSDPHWCRCTLAFRILLARNGRHTLPYMCFSSVTYLE